MKSLDVTATPSCQRALSRIFHTVVIVPSGFTVHVPASREGRSAASNGLVDPWASFTVRGLLLRKSNSEAKVFPPSSFVARLFSSAPMAIVTRLLAAVAPLVAAAPGPEPPGAGPAQARQARVRRIAQARPFRGSAGRANQGSIIPAPCSQNTATRREGQSGLVRGPTDPIHPERERCAPRNLPRLATRHGRPQVDGLQASRQRGDERIAMRNRDGEGGARGPAVERDRSGARGALPNAGRLCREPDVAVAI